MDWKYVLRKTAALSIIVLAAIEVGKTVPIVILLYALSIFVAAGIIILLIWAVNAIVS